MNILLNSFTKKPISNEKLIKRRKTEVMEKTSIILFNVSENCQFYGGFESHFKDSTKFHIQVFSDPKLAQAEIIKNGNAIFLFQVRNRDDLKKAILLLKSNKKLQKAHLFKPVCVTDIKNKKVENLLARNGCLDLVEPSMQFKTLNYKLEFWGRPIANAVKVNKTKQAFALKKQSSSRENNQIKKEFEIVPSIQANSDFWLIKSKFDYKRVLRSYLIRVLGPSPHIGKWHELDSQGDSLATWKFVVHNEEGMEYRFEDGSWFFVGSKPEFDWKIKRWVFSSERPHLYFYTKSDEVFSRFKYDSKQVLISENSKIALSREDDIFETCSSDFSFSGDKSKSIEGENLGHNENEELNTGKLKGRKDSEDSLGGKLRGKGSTDDIGSDPLAENLSGGEATNDGRLRGKGHTDDLSSDPLSGNASSEAYGKDPLAGVGKTENLSQDSLSGKSNTDDLSSDPLAGNVASEAYGKDPLAGKGHTDNITQDPLSGKSNTDDLSSDPLAGNVASEAYGKDPLAGKGHTDNITQDPLSGKSNTDDLGSDPLAGDVASEAYGKDPIAGKGSTDDLSRDQLDMDATNQARGSDPLNGNAKTNKLNREPLGVKTSKKEIGSSDPLAGSISAEAHGKDPLAGKGQTDKLTQDPLSGKSNTDDLSSDPLAGDVVSEAYGKDPLSGKSGTDDLSSDPLAGDVASEAHGKDPLAGKHTTDHLSRDPLTTKHNKSASKENLSDLSEDAELEKTEEEGGHNPNKAVAADKSDVLGIDPLNSLELTKEDGANRKAALSSKLDNKEILPEDHLSKNSKAVSNDGKNKKPRIQAVKVGLDPGDLENVEESSKQVKDELIGRRVERENKYANVAKEIRASGNSKETLEEDMAAILDGGFSNNSVSLDEDSTDEVDINLESGVMRVIISSDKSPNNACEMLDLFESEITVKLVKNHIALDDKVKVSISLSYASSQADMKVEGIVVESETDDDGTVLVISLKNIDQANYEKFMELYVWRQENISNFMKQAKGF